MQVTAGTMGPTHLVALYVATAGLQGNSLGTDEEEITLLCYVLIDALQNKVMGRQQYIVKPMVMEEESNGNGGSDNPAVAGSSGVVSDTALTHAPALTEQTLREHGIPLQQAIKQFETWWSSLTCVAAGSSPRFVVDGQAPLRQCLHPEACNKLIELPAHYTVFHDLRKEFSSCYSTNDELQMVSIQEMIQYYNIPPDTDNDYHVKEIQDMIAVIQRMIKDGHVFQNPEVVNLVLEPGICSKDEKVDNNCVVRARGLPWQSSDQDVAKFFRGLNVAKGGVALCLSAQGRRNGEAVVRFVSKEHRDMALKRHKHHIGSRYIEVYKASGDDFVSVAGGTNGEAHAFLSRGAQVIVRMRGLPYDCTAKQVLEFFASGQKPCQVLDGEEGVLFVKKADGRATGDAFVLFAKEDDAAKALSKHRDSIGSRYIELFRSTTAEVQQVLNRVSDVKPFERSVLPPLPTLLPQHFITSGTRKDCVRLRGLPYEALVEHILEFLGEHSKNIEYQGVHMVYNAQGQPSGEAFIQMNSEAAAYACATQRHHRYMIFGKKQRYIEVFQCSGEDMSLVLTGAPPPGKALLSPVAAAPNPGPPMPAQLQPNSLPVAAPPPGAAPLWDLHALMQAQAQAQAQVQAQAQAQVQAQAAQNQAAQVQLGLAQARAEAMAMRDRSFKHLKLMALASKNPAGNHPPASPDHNSKALALPSSIPLQPVTQAHPQSLAYGHEQQALHAQAVAAQQAGPFFFFNMPAAAAAAASHRIPILRPHAPHEFLAPGLIPGAPINPAALFGLKRTWESAFPAETAAAAPKRAAWQTPAAAFHATAQAATPGIAYPAQFFPQL